MYKEIQDQEIKMQIVIGIYTSNFELELVKRVDY